MVLKLTPKRIFWLKVAIHAINMMFFAYLVLLTVTEQLGADPVQGLSHFTGKAALHVLFMTLLISPIAKQFKLGAFIRVRRLVGLYCFSWAVLHVAVYLWLDLGLMWSLFWQETINRPYLLVGMLAFILLSALSITSFKRMQVKMGRFWQQLHNFVYLIAILAPIHFWWSVKSGWLTPAIYLGISVLLLSLRWSKLKRTVTKLSLNQP